MKNLKPHLVKSALLGVIIGLVSIFIARTISLNNFHSQVDKLFADETVKGWIVNEPYRKYNEKRIEEYIPWVKQFEGIDTTKSEFYRKYKKAFEKIDKYASRSNFVYELHSGGPNVQTFKRGKKRGSSVNVDPYVIHHYTLSPVQLLANRYSLDVSKTNNAITEYFKSASDIEELAKYRGALSDHVLPDLEGLASIETRYFNYIMEMYTHNEYYTMTNDNSMVILERIDHNYMPITNWANMIADFIAFTVIAIILLLGLFYWKQVKS